MDKYCSFKSICYIACDTNAKEYKLNPCEKTCDKCLYSCVNVFDKQG